MKVFEIIGTLITFSVVLLIDYPKLKATAGRKCRAVYFSVLAAALLMGMLEVLGLIPDYNQQLEDYFGRMLG